MSKLLNLIRALFGEQPARVIGALVAAVILVLQLLIDQGLDTSGILAMVLAILGGDQTARRVTPVEK